MSWYTRVTASIVNIPPCITYYENELDDARKELSLKGKSLEKHSAELPGIVEHRYRQLQEIEAILEHLNIKYRQIRSATFKKFLENYNKALSSRDAEKYVDGEQNVVDMAELLNQFALLRNKYLSIFKGLESKGWSLSHIVKLRSVGLDDATM